MSQNLREIYGGETYVTSLPDGVEVPWKALTYGDFIYYTDAFQENRVVKAIIEDEIFKKCVLNKAQTERIGLLKAGTVTTVVDHIMHASGPNSIEEFNEYLDHTRSKIINPLHTIPAVICRAFPAYKLEDIYQMDAGTVVMRLAQAELVLMEAGILKEPIRLYKDGELPQKRKMKSAGPELKSIWEKSEKFRDLNPKKPVATNTATKQDSIKPANHVVKTTESPAVEKRVNIDALVMDTLKAQDEMMYEDSTPVTKQMVNDAKVIYKDLIAKLKSKQVQKK